MKRIWSLFSVALLILPVVLVVAQADIPAVCLIGDQPSIPESDAETAALLVCDAAKAGHIGQFQWTNGSIKNYQIQYMGCFIEHAILQIPIHTKEQS